MSNSPILNIPGIENGTADGNTLRWEASTGRWEENTSLVVDDAGNVGIGTATPNFLLAVQGDKGVDASLSLFQIRDNDNTTRLNFTSYGTGATYSYWDNSLVIEGGNADQGGGGNIVFGRADGGANPGSLIFQQCNAGGRFEAMRIAPTGNVGIGTAAPATALQVHSAAGTQIRVSTDDALSTLRLTNNGHANLSINNDAGNTTFVHGSTEVMRIDPNGVVTGIAHGAAISQPDSNIEVVNALPGTPDANTIYIVLE